MSGMKILRVNTAEAADGGVHETGALLSALLPGVSAIEVWGVMSILGFFGNRSMYGSYWACLVIDGDDNLCDEHILPAADMAHSIVTMFPQPFIVKSTDEIEVGTALVSGGGTRYGSKLFYYKEAP